MSDKFIFDEDWRKIMGEFPAEVRKEVYDAVLGYAQSGTLLHLKPLARMAFLFIKRDIDANRRKQEQIALARSRAGKKGMAKRWNKHAPPDNKTPFVITNDNKNNKRIYNNNIILSHSVDNKLSTSFANDNIINAAAVTRTREDFSKTKISETPKKENENKTKTAELVLTPEPVNDDERRSRLALSVMQFYNDTVSRTPPGHRLRLARTLSPARAALVCEAVETHTLRLVKHAIVKASRSDWLTFQAAAAPFGFDWVVNTRNIAEILEDRYADKPDGHPLAESKRQAARKKALRDEENRLRQEQEARLRQMERDRARAVTYEQYLEMKKQKDKQP